MQAVGDRIIILPIVEEKTQGGIILATPKESSYATVVSIGDKVVSEMKVGDTICYVPGAGINIEKDNKQYKILRISEILYYDE